MGQPKSWVLAVLLLVSLFQEYRLVLSSLFRPAEAVMAPVDGLVFTGEVLTVQCKLQNLSYSIEKTYLDISSNMNNLAQLIPPENSTIVDNKTMRGTFEILPEFPGNFSVSCMSADKSLKSVTVYHERPIRNITNFSAIYFYDTSRLESTWDLGESYLDTDRINLIIDWNPNTPPNLNGTKCDQESWTSCSINILGQNIIFIRVNISHKKANSRPNATFLVPQYQTTAVSVYKLVIKDIMRVGRPVGLRVVDITSSCVNMTWQDTGYFSSGKDSFYHVTVTDLGKNETWILAESAVKLASEHVVQLCGLRPYTFYELSLSLRAYTINTWSDSSSVYFWTEEARPLSGPPVTDTSYSISQCQNQTRKLWLYWQDPSPETLQGQTTEFEVSRDNRNESLHLIKGSNSFKQDDIPCNASTEYRIYTVNKIGKSLTPSVMVIPQNEIVINKNLMFRVEENLTDSRVVKNVTVTWKSSDLNENITMVIYYCQETYVAYTCLNDFMVATVHLQEENITLYNIPISTNLFGFGLQNVNGEKRGIHWTECVYQSNLELPKPTGLKVNLGPSANSLSISWTPTPCSRTTKILIIGYQLSICKGIIDKSNELCQRVTIDDAYVDNYMAEGLEGNQPYTVFLQTSSPQGLSPESAGVQQTPFQSVPDLSGRQIVGVVMGALLAVILIAFILLTAWRCYKRKNKFSELIESENSVQETEDKTEANTENEDSGVGGSPVMSDSSSDQPVPLAPVCDPHFVETTAEESGCQPPDDYSRFSVWDDKHTAAQSRENHTSDSESICSGLSALALIQPNMDSILSGSPPRHNMVGCSSTLISLLPRQQSVPTLKPDAPTTLPTPPSQTVISHSPISNDVQIGPTQQVVFAIESSNIAPAQKQLTNLQPLHWQSSGSLAPIARSSWVQRSGDTDYVQQGMVQNNDTLSSTTDSLSGYVQQSMVQNNDTLSSTADSSSGYLQQGMVQNTVSSTTDSLSGYAQQGMVQNNDTFSSTTDSLSGYVQQSMVQNNDTLSSTTDSSSDYVQQGFQGSSDTGSHSLSLATSSPVNLVQQSLPDNNNTQLHTLNLASHSSDTSKNQNMFSKKGQEINNEVENRLSNLHIKQNDDVRMLCEETFLGDGNQEFSDTGGNNSNSSDGSCSELEIDADSLILKYHKSKTDQNIAGNNACLSSGFQAPKTGLFEAPETRLFAAPKTGLFETPETGLFAAPETGLFAAPETGPFVKEEDGDSPAGDNSITTKAMDIRINGNTFETSHPWPEFNTDHKIDRNVAQAESSTTISPSDCAVVPQPNSEYVSVNQGRHIHAGNVLPTFGEPAEKDDQESDSWSSYSSDGSTVC